MGNAYTIAEPYLRMAARRNVRKVIAGELAT